MSQEVIHYTVPEIERMSMHFAKSGLFGMKTVEQAFALMAIAQAQGLHPAIAAQDYHIIQGKPALKADAMLARFQNAGGKVVWNEYTDLRVEGTFTHPQGGTITIDWNMARAKAAKLSTDMWQKYPRQMLRSRVISEAIRAIFPGILGGSYSIEEVMDFEEPKMKDVTPAKPHPNAATPPITISGLEPDKIIEQTPSPDLATDKPSEIEKVGDNMSSPPEEQSFSTEPHEVPFVNDPDNVVSAWMKWVPQYAECIKSAHSMADLEAWITLNYLNQQSVMMSKDETMQKAGNKLRLTIEKRRKELMQLVEDRHEN